jgi:flagellar basal-body rod protein FlgG
MRAGLMDEPAETVMTTRGTMALVCLCVLSACLLVMTQASSERQPVRRDRFQPAVEQGEPVELHVADAASVGADADTRQKLPASVPSTEAGSFRHRKPAASATVPPFPLAGRIPTDVANARQPGRLPSPKAAAPLIPDPAQTAALRELIRREMPHASPSEIDVWVRKWRGMPLNSVRTMLEMRRAMPLLPRTADVPPIFPQPIPAPGVGTWQKLPASVPSTEAGSFRHGPKRPRLSPVPVSEPTPVDPSLVALRQARDVILNNVANANTPAFKRCRVVLSDLQLEESPALTQPGEPASLLSIGAGMRVAAIQRDWSPGKFVKTGRKLDFAIDGSGFFVVRRGKQRAYTRNGNFERDAGGSLVLAADRRWRVETVAQPREFKNPQGSDARKPRNKVTFSLGIRTDPFKRPPGNRKLELPVLSGALAPFAQAGMEVEIERADKNRRVKPADSHAAPRLAAVPNPDGLQPLGNGLFAETPSSGPAQFQRPKSAHVGTIQSGFLESSNVDTKRELAELRTVAGQIQALRTAEEMMKAAEPKPAPPGPIVEQPGARRMSSRQTQDWKTESDIWFDRLFHSEKYREIKRNLGMYDREPENLRPAAKPQPMAPPRKRNPVTPASFENLDSWEYPIEIEILFFQRSPSRTARRAAAG